jgi:hypothetical protein
LITNLKINPWKVWTDYVRRANVEKSIRELLNDLALKKIPTQNWTANVAHFQLLLFAYNLMHWFKRLCLPKEDLRKTVDTLRHELIALPGKLSCRNGKNVLLLPKNYHHQKAFLAASAKVENLKRRDQKI